jgi:superfamily I DNA/RNA helicase
MISAGNHNIKTISNTLKLGSDTRQMFLENIVKYAKNFLNERSNEKLFNEMLERAADEEGKVGSKNKPDHKAKGDWIARQLASCIVDDVHHLFYKLYDSDSLSPGEVHAPVDEVLTGLGLQIWSRGMGWR